MKATELQQGKIYDCTMDGILDGNNVIEKTDVVQLAFDAKTNRRWLINGARQLQKENPDFFRRLLAMSAQKLDEEDFEGGPDREWSRFVWRFTLDEQESLYNEDYELYLSDFAETVWQDLPAFVLGRKYTREGISKILGGEDTAIAPPGRVALK